MFVFYRTESFLALGKNSTEWVQMQKTERCVSLHTKETESFHT